MSEHRDRIAGTVRVAVARLEPHPKNWRTHGEHQREALRGSLDDLGVSRSLTGVPADPKEQAKLRKLKAREARERWCREFERSDGRVLLLDGHLRREEVRSKLVPVELLDLDAREQAELLATLDPIGALAGADTAVFLDLARDFSSTDPAVQKLVADVAAMNARGGDHVDLGLGSGGGEVGGGICGGGVALPGDDAEEEESVIPTDALVEKWGTAPGQLWVVPSLTVPGREHRLLCGDCRDPANVERLRAGRRPKLGLHDPPYGVNAVAPHAGAHGTVSGIQRGGKRHRRVYAPIEGDAGPFNPMHLLGTALTLVLWGGNCFADKLLSSPEWIVWQKLADGAGESDFSSCELAWVSPPTGRVGHVRRVVSLRGLGVIDGEQRLHPTQKPIKVQRAPIEWYSDPGDDVEDWYMGAGAVIIACEQTGRIGHGMDIAHAYLAATLERLSARGLSPRLVGEGA